MAIKGVKGNENMGLSTLSLKSSSEIYFLPTSPISALPYWLRKIWLPHAGYGLLGGR
jgi:hypothetical protein